MRTHVSYATDKRLEQSLEKGCLRLYNGHGSHFPRYTAIILPGNVAQCRLVWRRSMEINIPVNNCVPGLISYDLPFYLLFEDNKKINFLFLVCVPMKSQSCRAATIYTQDLKKHYRCKHLFTFVMFFFLSLFLL